VKSKKSPKKKREKFDKPCVALIQDSQRDMDGGRHQKSSLACALDTGEVYNVDAPENWLEEQVHNKKILSGVSKIMMPQNIFVDEENFDIKMVEMPTIMSPVIGSGAPDMRRLSTVEGTLSVLIVRVVASDATTTASESQLANSVFGNDNANPQSVNMRSQYQACSHGKLNFIEAPDRNGRSSRTRIRKGATTLYIENVSTTRGYSVMENAITMALGDEFGVSSPRQLASHVMYCLPPNTFANGVAYAYIGWWLSVYNDEWCLKLSAQMHELGHNLNLGHSNEIQPYRDQSGMMGFSYWEESAPLMCFNAAKLWELGWHSNRHQVVSSLQPFYIGEIAAFVDDPDIDGPPMLIKLETPSDEDYFINFNRRVSFNSGTKEGGDEVLVVLAGDGNGYSESDLKAKLGTGSTYKIPNFANGKEISVEVVGINLQRRVANVRICLGDCPPECTSNSQCDDEDPCTEDICLAGSCSFNRITSDLCDVCPGQSTLDVTIITDDFPRETSWTVLNQCTNTVQIQGGDYTEKQTAYTTGEVCVPKGRYIFTINDAYGDGICCNWGSGSFAITYNGSPIAINPQQFSFGSSTSITFGEECPDLLSGPMITSSPTANPTKSPTANPTKSPTKSPTKQPTSAPIATPTSEDKSCEDDRNFALILDNGNTRNCKWLTLNPVRTNNRVARYCPRDAVKAACPASCGFCATTCKDDNNFTFELNIGKIKGCAWFTQNEDNMQIRRERYCYLITDDGNSLVTPIGVACQFSCGLCGGDSS